ncbi:galactokinase [Terrimonas pollutisoli]|uniref:galactokinase n=1 Tax=Terrimonas pollutisoli TaxID=3034147 RepID=UPI0023ED05F1|nr:galactokinase [Terrimonas sp. H1YJ31]
MVKKIIRTFKEKFPGEPEVFRSPGRINLIGEHTDYNNGFVLPAAIDKEIIIAISLNHTDDCNFYATDVDESFFSPIDEIQRSSQVWPDYLTGVIVEFQKKNTQLSGVNVVIGGNIPIGAGLSSSAAVECCMTMAMNELFEAGMTEMEMIKLSQRAENNFVGVQCGIMDQFASMMGREGQVIKLDCRNLSYEYFPLRLGEYAIILFDTGVKHSLASSEYNTRREECAEGIKALQEIYPRIQSLRDVNPLQVNTYLKKIVTDEIFRRCKYVVEENLRVQIGCEDLLRNDIEAFGKKMFLTHEGLSQLYEVSCPELDWLVTKAKTDKRILGARMMGGGFGGCTINIVHQTAIDEISSDFGEAYKNKFGIALKTYPVQLSGGTSKIKLYEYV